MAVENTSFIGGLDSSVPTGSDPKSQGDDQIRLLKRALKQCFSGFPGEVLVTGSEAQGATQNDFLITVSPTLVSYSANTVVAFRATHTNSGPSTIRIGALSIKQLLSAEGTALRKNAISANMWCQASFDGTNFRLLTVNGDAVYDFINQTAFSAALPMQEGNSGKLLTTDGEDASWNELDAVFNFSQPDAGAIVRTYEDKNVEFPSTGDYTPLVWATKPWLNVPPGEYNLANDLYITGQISSGTRYAGPGKFITRESVLGLTKNFFIQSGTDSENNTIPNFIRRAIEIRRPSPTEMPNSISYERTPNSTALGKAVHFFCEYLSFSPSKTEELIPYIVLGADYLAAMQYRDPMTARFGGIKGAVNDNNTTCFGTAVAAKALLRAYKVTGKTRYLNAARNAVVYFKTLQNPNPVYQALYGETPIPDFPENVGFAGFCDRIQGSDTINITSADWNLVAASFLKEMYLLTGDASLPAIYTAAANYQVYGVENGCDYFAIRNPTPSAHVSTAWPFFTGHNYRDGKWHRYGEAATGSPNTVGTDQIEYGLSSLFEIGFDNARLLNIYNVYKNLQHADKGVTDFGNAFDSRICWTGFLRINSPNYGGSGGVPIDPATSRFFGGYYDVQGAGALLPFKRGLAPNDAPMAMALAQIAYLRGALVDQNFDTIWSARVGYETQTKGIIPIAMAGIGIIDSLEIAA